jgi:hypothetical protein
MEHTPERSFGQSPLLITEHLSQNEAGWPDWANVAY